MVRNDYAPSIEGTCPWNDGGRRRPEAPPAHHLRPAMTELSFVGATFALTRSLLEPPHPYLISLMMLNIGMYRATTAAPTNPPMIAIRIGSISDVSASTVASTSWS
jgi:hypothetical protein